MSVIQCHVASPLCDAQARPPARWLSVCFSYSWKGKPSTERREERAQKQTREESDRICPPDQFRVPDQNEDSDRNPDLPGGQPWSGRTEKEPPEQKIRDQ